MRGARPPGVQGQAHRVRRRLEELGVDLGGHQRDARIGLDEVPVAVHRGRRVRLVAGEDLAHGGADLGHLGRVEGRLGVDRRVATGKQELVALAQGHVELVGEAQHHVAARRRAPGLDEAEVARGDLGVEREVHLAEAPALAPAAQELANGERGDVLGGRHAVTVRRPRRDRDDLAGNRACDAGSAERRSRVRRATPRAARRHDRRRPRARRLPPVARLHPRAPPAPACTAGARAARTSRRRRTTAPA